MVKRQWQDPMNNSVLIIGGLGFVGYHIIRELKNKGYHVKIGSRSTLMDEHAEAPIIPIDLKFMKDEELRLILQDFDHVIFAGGADDRTIPKEDAAQFFYNENVVPCVRLAKLCNDLNTQKLIILGSYFTHFNRVRPEWKMADRHVYVRSRMLQEEETIDCSNGKLTVTILELPYIFGAAPNKVPLWKPLVKYINSMPILFYTAGGTNIVSVEMVAKATVGAIEHAKHGDKWIVGGQNVTWKEMIQMFALALGKKRTVITVPTFIVRFFSLLTVGYFKISGKQSGLNIFHFITTQTAQTYLDTDESKRILNYKDDNLQRSINETVIASGYPLKVNGKV
jgi:dihydroflavonol-4-reductase